MQLIKQLILLPDFGCHSYCMYWAFCCWLQRSSLDFGFILGRWNADSDCSLQPVSSLDGAMRHQQTCKGDSQIKLIYEKIHWTLTITLCLFGPPHCHNGKILNFCNLQSIPTQQSRDSNLAFNTLQGGARTFDRSLERLPWSANHLHSTPAPGTAYVCVIRVR